MEEFTMQVAGLAARIKPLFHSTGLYFRNYPAVEEPAFTVTVTREDLQYEQRMALEEALEEGFRPRVFPDPFLERAVIQRAFARELLKREVLLFHGSALALDGRAYLFAARSGTGKSTHTRLWCQVFGSRAVMINDDKPFLAFAPEGVTVHGSPWSGKHGLDANISVPLGGICILERGQRDRIAPLTPREALPLLRSQCVPAEDEATRARYDALTARLACAAPLWRMECTRDPEAARVAAGAMAGAQPL